MISDRENGGENFPRNRTNPRIRVYPKSRTYGRVPDGNPVLGRGGHVHVVIPHRHVAEGVPPRLVERGEELLPPVLRQLANDPVALVADELDDVSVAQDGLGGGANL